MPQINIFLSKLSSSINGSKNFGIATGCLLQVVAAHAEATGAVQRLAGYIRRVRRLEGRHLILDALLVAQLVEKLPEELQHVAVAVISLDLSKEYDFYWFLMAEL